jgi:hypothetical protein
MKFYTRFYFHLEHNWLNIYQSKKLFKKVIGKYEIHVLFNLKFLHKSHISRQLNKKRYNMFTFRNLYIQQSTVVFRMHMKIA